MAVSKNCKNGPLSPIERATGLFFLKKFTNKSLNSAAQGLGGKERGRSPPQQAIGGCRPSLGRPVREARTRLHASIRAAG